MYVDACVAFAANIQILFLSLWIIPQRNSRNVQYVCVLLDILPISLLCYANEMYFESWNANAGKLSKLRITDSFVNMPKS